MEQQTTKDTVWLDFKIDLESLEVGQDLQLERKESDDHRADGVNIKLQGVAEPYDGCKVYRLVVDYRVGPKRMELIEKKQQ